jgi:ribosome biogenesis GTPase
VTTHRQLVLVSGGGLLIDTPGMRELELLDAEGLDAVFGDIAALAAHCRYRDCRHEAEPGCAVTRAVEAGELDAARLEHHQKLEREGRAYELRHDERRRRQAERAFGKLKNEVVRAGKRKEGKR